MVMKVLLDTNAYSALMVGRTEVADCVRRSERVLLSTIVIGELLFGFRNGNQFKGTSINSECPPSQGREDIGQSP